MAARKYTRRYAGKTRSKGPFTLEPGREIYLHGEPFISIGREGKTHPVDADDVTRTIVDLLNDFSKHG